ncbi:hypothetical protein ONE63_010817 [Megalurothrips usitatus]|uniref:SOCS box domain-containing protein n=1 Tax=Megalurothrips usitatus TaxID=439358 RepID=A0AAV7XIH1_9NEOP|nr:hypothetical protein ONE63_010817 [Megalurothrips usitatus]
MRRTAVDTPTLAPCEDPEPDVGDGGSASPGRCGGCAGPPGSCPQPLLHLFSGDLDRCWADVVLALRLLVRPAAEAGDSPGTVSVNGVTVGVAGGRVQVRVCGREADAFATSLQCWVTGRDAAGHTALLLAGRRLLSAGRWADAALVASLLLDAGSDANAVNRDGRSLLSYAVAALDDAAETSRLLLNHGASVLGAGPHDAVPPTLRPTLTPGGGAEPCPSSPVFAWFLRAVIRRRRLDEGCLRTLALVSQEMAEQMGPRRMHGLVLRTMFRHSRCYRVLGPVFLQIKTAMARHWSTPQDLRSLCRCVIRRSLGVPSAHGPAAGGARLPLHQSVRALGLPRPLQEYLLLYA